MSKDRIHSRRSRLSRSLMLKYFVSLAAYIATIVAVVFFSWQFCSMFSWYETNPLYQLMQFVKENIIIIVGLVFFVGWVIITYYFITKPLRFLDDVISAAEKLAVDVSEPVVLPDSMIDTQNELNLVREKALSDRAAANESEKRKNDLIVYLAHDLKTPLTSIIGYLTLLRDEPEISPELRAKYTGIALEKAERLEMLINEFFDITRFNLTKLSLTYESVNLTRMIEQITYEFGPVLEEKSLCWRLDLTPNTSILCDPEKLERVFDNLFRNAINYCYQNTEISVSLTTADGMAEIIVSNRGKTIESEQLSRLFEQFFRLDSSRTSSTGGAGLGLAIAHDIVALHGGTISADSKDESITFTVRLPLDRKKIV